MQPSKQCKAHKVYLVYTNHNSGMAEVNICMLHAVQQPALLLCLWAAYD